MLGNFSDQGPCRRKTRRPPSSAALAEARWIRRTRAGEDGQEVVVDFARYAAQARPLDTEAGQP